MTSRTFTIVALIMVAGHAAADTLIHAGSLIDGVGNRAVNDRTIRITGSNITAIEDGFTEPGPNDVVIDARDSTIMPGLIDTHVHLTGEYSARSNLNRFTLNEADYAFDAAKYAKRTLNAGFTVVRNVGDAFNVTIALRKAINAGDVPGGAHPTKRFAVMHGLADFDVILDIFKVGIARINILTVVDQDGETIAGIIACFENRPGAAGKHTACRTRGNIEAVMRTRAAGQSAHTKARTDAGIVGGRRDQRYAMHHDKPGIADNFAL